MRNLLRKLGRIPETNYTYQPASALPTILIGKDVELLTADTHINVSCAEKNMQHTPIPNHSTRRKNTSNNQTESTSSQRPSSKENLKNPMTIGTEELDIGQRNTSTVDKHATTLPTPVRGARMAGMLSGFKYPDTRYIKEGFKASPSYLEKMGMDASPTSIPHWIRPQNLRL